MKAAIEKLRSVFADQDLKEAGILMDVNGILATISNCWKTAPDLIPG